MRRERRALSDTRHSRHRSNQRHNTEQHHQQQRDGHTKARKLSLNTMRFRKAPPLSESPASGTHQGHVSGPNNQQHNRADAARRRCDDTVSSGPTLRHCAACAPSRRKVPAVRRRTKLRRPGSSKRSCTDNQTSLQAGGSAGTQQVGRQRTASAYVSARPTKATLAMCNSKATTVRAKTRSVALARRRRWAVGAANASRWLGVGGVSTRPLICGTATSRAITTASDSEVRRSDNTGLCVAQPQRANVELM